MDTVTVLTVALTGCIGILSGLFVGWYAGVISSHAIVRDLLAKIERLEKGQR